jgi:hypothetical protein
MQGLRNAGNILNFLGPQADIQEMTLSSQAAMDNLRRGELGLGGLNLAYAAAAPLGLFLPGTVSNPFRSRPPVKPLELHMDTLTGPQLGNGDIGFAVARPPDLTGFHVSEKGTQKIKFSVFDMKKKGPPVDVGVVTMNVTKSPSGELTPKIQGLINIEINKELRGQGLGKRVVDALAASSPDGLRLYDIQKKARGYWERLGAIDFKKRPGGPYLDAVLPPPPKP